eukprot:s801_g9.t1
MQEAVALHPFRCSAIHQPSDAMKTLLTEETVKVPKGVKITIKSKIVEVTGKHGSLKRDFKHLPIEIFLSDGGKKVTARMYFAKSKQCSMLNSVCSHIANLFEGVMHKFEYKMRLVYAHFPINANIINGGKTIEIRNFLGEKVVRTVHMLPGVTVEKSASTKIYVGFRETQNFSVVFDTGSGHFFLPSVDCSSESCRSHRKYDVKRSSTAKFVDHDGAPAERSEDEVAISFGTGSIRGNFVEELVCFSEPKGTDAKADNGCARINLVTATQMTDEPFSSFSFDGVVGLGLGALAVEPNFSIFQQLTKITHSNFMPQFAYFLSEHDDLPSEISFGGHNPKRMQSALRWVPVFKPELGFWQVRILRLSVDGKELDFCRDGDCVAIADTGTSLLGSLPHFDSNCSVR